MDAIGFLDAGERRNFLSQFSPSREQLECALDRALESMPTQEADYFRKLILLRYDVVVCGKDFNKCFTSNQTTTINFMRLE